MDVICKQLSDEVPDAKTDVLKGTEKGILCASCNHLITDPEKQIVMNQSYRHVFANPHGYVFEIACFSSAKGCRPASITSSEFTWFPGFLWQTGVCEQCLSHIGWVFTSDRQIFFGLIMENLIFP